MARRRARPGGGAQGEVTIQSLGGRGDGVATWQGRPLFVPLSLPGDRIRVRVTGSRDGAFVGEMLELLDEGPERASPPCPHFGPCGGCSLQHLSAEAYRRWKRQLVETALARRGLAAAPLEPLVAVPAGTRRRVTLVGERRGGRVVLGLHQRRSRRLVPLEVCRLILPALSGLITPLGALLTALETDRASVTLTALPGGHDLLLALPQAPDLAAREALAAFAEARDLVRVSWRALGAEDEEGEPLVVRRAPEAILGGVPVEVPPGAFLQPSAEGEAALVRAVMAGLADPGSGARRLVDLYAGLGTFSLPASGLGSVVAYEGSAPAVSALARAAGRSGLGGKLRAEVRDLAQHPLDPPELAPYDALIFDPPRAGARAQAEAIARSTLARVVAVSCNPATFARDARILVDGGFTLGAVTPVDQFPWSGHVELVAQFSR